MGFIRAAAGAATRLEQLHVKIINGDPVDDRLIVRMTNAVSRALRGLDVMKAKAEKTSSEGLTLAQYLAEKAQAKAEEATSP
jgi:hypothetical protein